MRENEVDVSKTQCIGPKLFDAKCTRLACLLNLPSLFQMYSFEMFVFTFGTVFYQIFFFWNIFFGKISKHNIILHFSL